MKITEIKQDLKNTPKHEIDAKIDALQRELFGLKINKVTAQVKDYSQFKKFRKNIARAKTYKRQWVMNAQ